VVAIENPSKRIYGLQYHPEVMHTENGTDTLRHVLLELGGLKADWTMAEVLAETLKMIEKQVGDGCCIRVLHQGAASGCSLSLVRRVRREPTAPEGPLGVAVHGRQP
jgi:GMP synthase (glutamine-hydrolysing)